ncbi:ribonuclease T2 [Trichodelitschia bisporula]|uniref:ribonuclease T2 n=1 Tax=Trichodelitschia bisporula TaxID=703511 RepID=A0A6G1HQ48_9PEZI|nr:ribonuclease T2 [Trichodelitschia bisporula]
MSWTAVLCFAWTLFTFTPSTTSSPLSAGFCSIEEQHVLSCSNSSLTAKSCCTETPGGLMILAQMYSWEPALGPGDTWLMHGLWNDYCNGSYPADCDPKRAYTDIPNLLSSHHQKPLIKAMAKSWKNDPPITGVNGTSPDLWAHEWSKHGTCMSTLSPACYPHYAPKLEAVDYFKTAFQLYLTLPTHDYLSDCGIVPSASATYDLADIQSCLVYATEALPRVGCDKNGTLNELWYVYHLRGRVPHGRFEGTDSPTKSNCPAHGVKYLPKARAKTGSKEAGSKL